MSSVLNIDYFNAFFQLCIVRLQLLVENTLTFLFVLHFYFLLAITLDIFYFSTAELI